MNEESVGMGDYRSVRIWQLKSGFIATDLEALANSGYIEMQRWIAGVKRVSLQRVGDHETEWYVLHTTFNSEQAYKHWRQVEEEAADYWERYAAISMQWEGMCYLVGEYAGEIVMDVGFEEDS
jgi:heme-degrading monooxygenase HmoA